MMEKSSITIWESIKKEKDRILFFTNSVLIYLLTYFVAYHVPMHSDDYFYFQQGLSLKTHIKHYITWSGRFITDYTSALLLNLFKRPVYMAINSFVLLVIIILITILPNIVRKKRIIDKSSFVILWIVFMLYWVSNPDLGQTSFWLVGSANYLWTLMWASIYFALFLHLLQLEEKVGITKMIILFVVGIFAGLSNEAIGLTVVLFNMIMIIMFWKEKTYLLLVGLVSTCIGCALLYFAPGNYMRLGNAVYDEWNELSIVEKFIEHVFSRMSDALGGLYLVYLIFILMFIAVVWIYNGRKINDYNFKFSLIYCLLSICSILAFIVVPTMPARSANTCLYYALLGLSFIANLLTDTEDRYGILSLYGMTLICGIYFSISYAFVSYAYVQTKIQADIRESIIEDTKADGKDATVIPEWYFTRLAKQTDDFDLYISNSMPSYYGLSNIEWKGVTFNYAIIENTRPIRINKKLKNGLILENMYVKLNAPFEQTFVFEFNDSLMNYIEEDRKLYIYMYDEDKDEIFNAYISLNNFVQIGDKYYYGRTILTPNIDELNTICFDFYNPDASIKSAEYILNLKEYYNKQR